ncbi:hypothetical protein [Microbacterium elymi]|uniref:Uncharacterized protein n=1 Tax=Microbacterium elymi TaxID=2909587 RepID=A0ABY5NL49_9MICO|nr:hypothetical protein [Microbacterium elymi]UUT35873.1 hypothetical protein L2X98_22205 [Microbacterium elymi]
MLLPAEIDTPPFGIGQQPSEARQVDVLNVFDDGSFADHTGDLTSTALTGFGMGPGVTYTGRTSFGEPGSYPGGISYGTITVDANGDFVTDASKTTIEVLNIMLGQGNDTLTIHSTMIPGPDQPADDKLPVGIPALHGGLTLVQGGGNALLAGDRHVHLGARHRRHRHPDPHRRRVVARRRLRGRPAHHAAGQRGLRRLHDHRVRRHRRADDACAGPLWALRPPAPWPARSRSTTPRRPRPATCASAATTSSSWTAPASAPVRPARPRRS